MDLGYLLRHGAGENPSATAVSAPQGRLTYGELDADAGRLANALLGLGLRPGDRVAVLLRNRLEYPVVDVALASAGLVRVALNVRLDPGTFRYIAADCEVRALITEAAFDEISAELSAEAAIPWLRIGEPGSEPPAKALDYRTTLDAARPEHPPERDRTDELAWISYTSGSTGRPKGVMLSHRALVRVAVNLMVELGAETTADSVLLVQPLSHGAGYFALAYLACGGHLHVRHGFDPEEAVRLGRDEHINTLKLVPTMLMDMLEVAETPAYRNIVYGAAPIASDVLGSALERYGPVLAQLYGQSEAPMTITWLPKADHRVGEERVRSVGRAWRGVRVDVVDENGVALRPGEMGEIVVSGHHLMDGYWAKPELTADTLKDGRLWTRDMGHRDEHGYVYLRGRRDDMINSGGFNIAPKEVEDVVVRFPGVREASAIGVADQRWGEAVRVFVAPERGVVLDEQALIEFCKPELGFRRPRSVIVVPELPRTPYGKVDRLSLRTHSTG
ncbi:class I adenylate-forming enzyme family protein [Pseudonocardia acaciae]|uniref:class I adenylate-forming enzyme family protein n=1 Tax=Pseudonocardia acaciae TaxID=551276 RepID=UPI00048A44D2|nr:AMP-binding protein [Pseudonocardia acaciae]